jgi:hypothetical protein
MIKGNERNRKLVAVVVIIIFIGFSLIPDIIFFSLPSHIGFGLELNWLFTQQIFQVKKTNYSTIYSSKSLEIKSRQEDHLLFSLA